MNFAIGVIIGSVITSWFLHSVFSKIKNFIEESITGLELRISRELTSLAEKFEKKV